MITSRVVFAAATLLTASGAHAAYDANGVPLGGTEAQIKKAFPSALCKPLEWTSRAADRRCDDAKILFAGTDARITFYLRKDAIQAFDVRFDTKELDKVTAFLKSRYGKPAAESKDAIERQGKAAREIYKVRWESAGDHAVMVSQLEKSRTQLTVSRGDFEEEIYRVR